MLSCPVCGASCSALPHCCSSVGPRIGQQAPRCVRPPGHDGDHQAHESWNAAVDANEKPVTWADLVATPEPQRMRVPPGHTVSCRSTQRWQWGTFELAIGPANSAENITDEQRDAFELVDWFAKKLTERWDAGKSTADLMAALEHAVVEVTP